MPFFGVQGARFALVRRPALSARRLTPVAADERRARRGCQARPASDDRRARTHTSVKTGQKAGISGKLPAFRLPGRQALSMSASARAPRAHALAGALAPPHRSTGPIRSPRSLRMPLAGHVASERGLRRTVSTGSPKTFRFSAFVVGRRGIVERGRYGYDERFGRVIAAPLRAG